MTEKPRNEIIEILGERYQFKEMRCGKCNKLLGKGIGDFEIKCPRCGTMNASKESVEYGNENV